MHAIEVCLEKLKPLQGKKLFLTENRSVYFLRENDHKLPFLKEINEMLSVSDDEYGDDFEFENYRVIACNGVTPLENRIVISGINEIYALNLETLRVIKIKDSYHELTFDSIEEFLGSILVKNGSSRVYL